MSDLLQVISDLTEFEVLTLLLTEEEESADFIEIQVKERGTNSSALLPSLKKCHRIIDDIDLDGEIFVPVHDEFDDLIEYLDSNYSIKSKWLKSPEFLRQKDSEKVSEALDSIIRSLIGYSNNLRFIPDLDKSDKKYSQLIKSLNKSSKDDFQEAMKAYRFGLTTASLMLFCRVAEKMASSYYEKYTKNNSKDKSWDLMRQEINNKQHQEDNVKWAVLNLFGFLKEKRNVAQHPGERFDERDCENIIHILDEFEKEISRH